MLFVKIQLFLMKKSLDRGENNSLCHETEMTVKSGSNDNGDIRIAVVPVRRRMRKHMPT